MVIFQASGDEQKITLPVGGAIFRGSWLVSASSHCAWQPRSNTCDAAVAAATEILFLFTADRYHNMSTYSKRYRQEKQGRWTSLIWLFVIVITRPLEKGNRSPGERHVIIVAMCLVAGMLRLAAITAVTEMSFVISGCITSTRYRQEKQTSY